MRNQLIIISPLSAVSTVLAHSFHFNQFREEKKYFILPFAISECCECIFFSIRVYKIAFKFHHILYSAWNECVCASLASTYLWLYTSIYESYSKYRDDHCICKSNFNQPHIHAQVKYHSIIWPYLLTSSFLYSYVYVRVRSRYCVIKLHLSLFFFFCSALSCMPCVCVYHLYGNFFFPLFYLFDSVFVELAFFMMWLW